MVTLSHGAGVISLSFRKMAKNEQKKTTKPKKNLPPLSRATQNQFTKFFRRSTLEGLPFVTMIFDWSNSHAKDVKNARQNSVCGWLEIVFLYHSFYIFGSIWYALFAPKLVCIFSDWLLFTIHGIASLYCIGYTV